jgi:phosphoribosyl-AMP cyclohydrolase
MASPAFAPPGNKAAVEEGTAFTPKFDAAGLITCVTVERGTGTVLMVAFMNAEALRLTLETGVVHYWSRSRNALWRKGDTSGQVQRLVAMHTDCDQDTLLLSVEVGGDGHACHTGRHSCFYRQVAMENGEPRLRGDDTPT